MRERLQRLGVLRESGHEHFNGSLVVPIFGEAGRCSRSTAGRSGPTCAGRHADSPVPAGPAPRRLQRRSAGVGKEVILCEALIDALTFWCAGYRNVTASLRGRGLHGRPPGGLQEHGIERVLIAYDRDDAGERAAAASPSGLQAHGARMLPRAVPEGHGRQRVRAEGAAGREEPGRAAAGPPCGSARATPPAADLGALTRAIEVLPAAVNTSSDAVPRQEPSAAQPEPEERPAPVSRSPPLRAAPALRSPLGLSPLAAKEELTPRTRRSRGGRADLRIRRPRATASRGLARRTSRHDALKVNRGGRSGRARSTSTRSTSTRRRPRAAFVKPGRRRAREPRGRGEARPGPACC